MPGRTRAAQLEPFDMAYCLVFEDQRDRILTLHFIAFRRKQLQEIQFSSRQRNLIRANVIFARVFI